ncbi:MAG: general secretion pathway protein GspG [Acidobacteria bacterium]|jgi:general secretion pathway protein G|nr:MAG: general secretion pathway protein GspG [Acidobacteriota bacterium]
MKSTRGTRGFTLLEMMVVITILLILLAIAVPLYSQSMNHARETNLRQNLETLNRVIVQYTLDKKKAPQSLNDLVQSGYIEAIPDDITGRNDTWVPEQDDSVMSPEQTDPGVSGVHSGSDHVASDGTTYSSW